MCGRNVILYGRSLYDPRKMSIFCCVDWKSKMAVRRVWRYQRGNQNT